MSCMITATGVEYHLFGEHAMTDAGRPVRIEDIAHQLATINRFHGATSRPYSVAEHSLLCSEIAERAMMKPITQLAALLLDAHEIYTNDLSSPAKCAVNLCAILAGGTRAWDIFENVHARAVRDHFGISTVSRTMHTALRNIDLVALATERRDLLPWRANAHSPWSVLRDDRDDAIEPLVWTRLDTPERAAMTWQDWRQQFKDRFDELQFRLELNRTDGARDGVTR